MPVGGEPEVKSGSCAHFSSGSPGCKVFSSKARSQDISGVGHQIGPPLLYTSPTCAPVGAMIRTASSGAGELGSRGRVFQPKGLLTIVPSGYTAEMLSQWIVSVPVGSW